MAGDLEQPAVLAAEPDRNDRRPRALHQRGDERLPAGVDGGRRPSRSGAVETAPAGNTTTAPPRSRCARAARATATLVSVASGVLGEIDRQDEVADLGRAHQHGVGQHDEIAADLLDQPGDDDAVEHAVRVVGDDDERAGRGQAGERRRVVAHVDVELAHRGGEEALAGARMALVVEISRFSRGWPVARSTRRISAALDRRISAVA